MYQAKDYSHLLGLTGFSDNLLNNHFKLYQGYVANTNKNAELAEKHLKEGNTYEYAEMKRRFGWEWNGMRLHEYYFENLTRNPMPINQSSELFKQIEKDFASFEDWEKDFKAIATMRGIGWMILYFDKSTGKLINTWINEHDLGHLAGTIPLLVFDVFEHAFMIDYGLNRTDYIAAFMGAIAWQEVESRLPKF